MHEVSERQIRFLILSDTHSITPELPSNIPAVDVVLHCGDLTEEGKEEEHKKTYALLANIKAEVKLVIAGNHDLTLDERLCEDFGVTAQHERVMELWTGSAAQEQGIRYLSEGVHTITLADGRSFNIYASPYTPKFGGRWAFQYPPAQDRYDPKTAAPNAQPIPSNTRIDIVMTHCPPKFLLDECGNGSNGGCEHLLKALRRCRPLLHCFGHIHESYGAQIIEWQDEAEKTNEQGVEALQKEWVGRNQMRRNGYLRKNATSLCRGEQTLLINAAILDGEHEASNVPWIVDLDLERG